MYIAIATLNFNVDGHLYFQAGPGTSLFNYQRRVSRTKTLDGGVFIDDRVFAHGDRTLDISVSLSRADFEKIRAITQNSTQVRISFSDGVFLGSISNLSLTDTLQTEIQILIGKVYG